MNRLGTYVVLVGLFAILALILIYGPLGGNSESHSYTTVESIGLGEQNRWNQNGVSSPVVLYNADIPGYDMWYVGTGTNNRSGIGHATSTNGIDWNVPADPIMTTQNDWEAHGFRDVHVLHDGSNYRMWYTAEGNDGARAIGYATSQDGQHWSKSANNPVLRHGNEGSWDSVSVSEPFVVETDGTWRMWFTGVGDNGVAQIGYASSTDGIHWSDAPINPVFTGRSDWDAAGVSGAFVDMQYNGQLFEMWFSGVAKGKNQVHSLGRAYSNDGITWAEDTESNPVVIADKKSFTNPWVAYADSIAYIWTGQIGRAHV